MPIQLLSDEVISQIAAGEVVERPASVVKELLENALDANASSIHIEAVAGGQKRLRVSDDGDGIRADEVELAVTRHATSKLASADDLAHIHTLGFRGEALASIAAVSRFTLVTRHRDDDVGCEIRVEGGRIAKQKPIGAPAGTVVTVENLFYNVPARLKFLKSENTEKRHINNIVQEYAMAYPDVRFVLVQDGRENFRSPGSGQLGDVIVKVLGLDYFKQMLEINGETRIRETGGEIGVYGFISQPSLHRKDRTRITLFVNGRAVQDNSLTYAVTQAYHNLIEKGRHPYAVLMLSVPPYFVDVNVHPTKAEVRFQDTNIIFTAVQRTVRQGAVGHLQADQHQVFSKSSRSMSDTAKGWSLPYDHKRQMDMELPLDETDAYADDPDAYDPNDPTAIPEGMGRPQKPRTLPLLRVVGQVGAAYIVAEGPAGMYLIDQHAAHTRIIYEELLELHTQDDEQVIPQRELQAQTIDVSQPEAQLLNAHLARLERLGVRLEAFGATTFNIRAIPAVITGSDPVAFVWALVEALQADDDRPLDERLLICIAERAAVKAGQILETGDMRGLVRKLERAPNPQTSPRGRATLIHMSADQLAREFTR